MSNKQKQSIMSNKLKQETIINKIKIIIEEYGFFDVNDVEASYSPSLNGGRLSQLMEEFNVDGGIVNIYDPQNNNLNPIDSFEANYDELPLKELEYVLKLAEKWKEYMDV